MGFNVNCIETLHDESDILLHQFKTQIASSQTLSTTNGIKPDTVSNKDTYIYIHFHNTAADRSITFYNRQTICTRGFK